MHFKLQESKGLFGNVVLVTLFVFFGNTCNVV